MTVVCSGERDQSPQDARELVRSRWPALTASTLAYHLCVFGVLYASLQAAGVSLPYGCRYGGCISCAAKLLQGEVDQRAGVALNGRQLAQGYVLLCVARPLSDCTFDVGVESHDKLYRNPFADPLAPHELKPDIAGPRRHVP